MEVLAVRLNELGTPSRPPKVLRLGKAGLKPWRTESWMTSQDPDSWEWAA